MADIMTSIMNNAKSKKRHIVLPEGFEPRMIEAAAILVKNEICSITLLGKEEEIQKVAVEKNINLDGINIIDPENSELNDELSEILYEKRKKKGMTKEQAAETTKKFLYFGNLMVKAGKADGCVAGAYSTTGDVMRSCLQVIGVKKGTSLVSTCFMMVLPDGRIFNFGDCALVPDPDAEGLASIAISTADTYQKLTGDQPKVAMLSFSSKGSGGNQPSVLKVQEATKIAQEKAPELALDGDLQFDAALLDSIGKKKAPDSKVAGQANVFIFPDLNSGNIGYKIAQRLGGAEAIGPIVQGLALPSFDLSRGCSVDDIVKTSALCALMGE